jgi:hypothetical protein
VKEPYYLFLISSTLKEKQRKEIFRLYILKNRISNLLVFDKKDKYTNPEKKFNVTNPLANILNQIEITDEIIDGEILINSEQRTQPLRSNSQTESISINLRGETIPMAHSSFFRLLE